MVNIQALHKSFKKNHVLKGFDLSLTEPGIYAVVGPNGSGKTTLIKCILGMVIPNTGVIKVNEKDIKDDYKYREMISYVPQIAKFPENLTVGELIEMISNIRPGSSNYNELKDLFGLDEFIDVGLGNLSGGMKQKVNLTLALMYDSPLIILDEPTAGLDPVALLKLKEWLYMEKAKGKIILITTHIMSLVDEMSDRIIFLLDGTIKYSGDINDLKKRYSASRVDQAIANLLEDGTTDKHLQN